MLLHSLERTYEADFCFCVCLHDSELYEGAKLKVL